jgi:hypothetical protein
MGKVEARVDMAAAKLTTRIRDSQKVEFPKSLSGFPAPGLLWRESIGRPEARKEVVLSGNV